MRCAYYLVLRVKRTFEWALVFYLKVLQFDRTFVDAQAAMHHRNRGDGFGYPEKGTLYACPDQLPVDESGRKFVHAKNIYIISRKWLYPICRVAWFHLRQLTAVAVMVNVLYI